MRSAPAAHALHAKAADVVVGEARFAREVLTTEAAHRWLRRLQLRLRQLGQRGQWPREDVLVDDLVHGGRDTCQMKVDA